MNKSKNGMIENNVFYKSVEDSPSLKCALWIHENEKKVKNKIKNTFSSMGYGGYAVDECYEYMLYYFVEYTNKAFDKNYHVHKEVLEKLDSTETLEDIADLEKFLEESDTSSYKMEHYILSRVRNVALGYIRHLKRQRDMLTLEDEIFEDESYRGYNVITHDMASIQDVNYVKCIENEPDLIAEFEDLQDILDNELSIYDKDFQDKNLKGFDTKKFVQSMFLKGLSGEEEIAKDMGINIAQLNNYISGFKAIVSNECDEGGEYYDLRNSIQALVEGIKHGWKPIIRD